MTTSETLRATSLRVQFGEREALRGIDLSVSNGEIVAIVGRSGAGKTVLLRTLGGLQSASVGAVALEGKDFHQPPKGLVVVFQDYEQALLPWRNVLRNVELGIESRYGKHERRSHATRALEMVGLADKAAEDPRQLSGGMAQRVQIARALAMEPSVLLMDEPFGSLDAFTKAALQDVLLDVHARTHATVVFVTHDLDEAIYLSDRVLVLSDGQFIAELPTDIPRPRNQVSTRALPQFLAVRANLARALNDG